MLVEFKNIGLEVAEHKKHEWTMPTRDVARGYEVSESVLRDHKRKHADELIEGKHFLCVSNIDAQNATGNSKTREATLWTKKGVIRLGFWIRSERAKLFRDWAEEIILEHMRGGTKCKQSKNLPSGAAINTLVKQFGKESALRMLTDYIGIDGDKADEIMQSFYNQAEEFKNQVVVVSQETKDFVSSRIINQKGFTSVDEIYQEYAAYCAVNDYETLAKVNFGKEFKAATGLEAKVVKIRGVATRGYEGIAIAQLTIDAIES